MFVHLHWTHSNGFQLLNSPIQTIKVAILPAVNIAFDYLITGPNMIIAYVM